MTQQLLYPSDEPVPPVEADQATLGQARTVQDHVDKLERLADQAAFDDLRGLQDACLLLMEALNEMPSGPLAASRPDLSALLDGWPGLIENYLQSPGAATGDILEFLRRPEWSLPLADEEFTMLEEGLRAWGGDELAESEPAAATAESEPTVAAVESTLALSPAPPEKASTPSAPIEPVCAAPRIDLSARPRAVRELIELLLLAAGAVEMALSALLENPAAFGEGLERIEESLERFARASKTVGFEGLTKACVQVGSSIECYRYGQAPFDDKAPVLLGRWLAQVKAYLPDFDNEAAGQAMLASLSDEGWPKPLLAEEGAAILNLMRTSDMTVGNQPEPVRPQEAKAEDVSLALPGDVNRELLELLLHDLPGYTEQLSTALLRLRSGGGQADIEIAQRVAHTLKGAANTVGIRGIAVLTHHLEDILLVCAKEHKTPGTVLLDSIIDAADCLEGMSEALLGLGDPPGEAQDVLQGIMDWANRIDREGLPATDQEAPPPRRPAQSSEPPETSEPSRADAADEAGGPADSEPAAQTPMIRVPTDRIEYLFRLSGESIILNSQAQERLRRLTNQLQSMETQFDLLRQLGAELEQMIDVKDMTGRFGTAKAGFDSLEMDQYNELYTVSRRMVEATVDARQTGLDIKKELEHLGEVLEYQQHLVIDTQEAVMQTRLVPIASIAPRLQRSLRQTCRLTGKQAELALTGESLPIDGDTLNALVDPLMHILRNAVDHGLEDEDERVALGKPRTGHLTFEFDREGNSIVVHCRDDGRGLNLAAIRATGESRGLLRPGQEVPDAELERLILRPNFSTRTQSTQTSGRGVGMDVVQARIAAMGGTLALHSTPGRGLNIEMKVPLPLSRSHALLAYAGPHRVAIANKGLMQIIYSGDGELRDLGHGQVLLLGEALYPVARLKDLLHVEDRRRGETIHGAVLLVQHGDAATAVLVDSITDSRDIVIKNFGHYIPKIPGLIGATILGDGSVTPVLDIPALLRLTEHAPHRTLAGPSVAVKVVDEEPRLPTALVVDDSLSQRRALEQLLEDAGFRVRAARDGLEAAELLAHTKPDIVLTDLEMPRMNGIELTSHIRARPGLKDLPVLMVTSRTTQKHRQLAEQAGIDGYFTKPVKDEDLLATMRDLMEGTASRVRKGRA
ncbi:hybrid sensor histidine kinase/response regulator [Methylomagnum sp.]